MADGTNGIGKYVDVRQDGMKRSLSEHAVTGIPATWTGDALALADGEWWKVVMQVEFFSIFFTEAVHDLLVPARPDSTSATQALFMLNNEVALKAASQIAEKTISQSDDARQRIRHLYEHLFGRPPAAEEITLAIQILEQSQEARQKLKSSKKGEVDLKTGPWEDLCLALICSNEFLYVD